MPPMLSRADHAALLAEHRARLRTMRRLAPPGTRYPGQSQAFDHDADQREVMRLTVILAISVTALAWSLN